MRPSTSNPVSAIFAQCIAHTFAHRKWTRPQDALDVPVSESENAGTSEALSALFVITAGAANPGKASHRNAAVGNLYLAAPRDLTEIPGKLRLEL